MSFATPKIFAPLTTSFLGFDSFFEELDRMIEISSKLSAPQNGFPPLNLYKEQDDGYTLELAVAGFKIDDIKIEHDQDRRMLTITGDNSKRDKDTAGTTLSTFIEGAIPGREIISRGIATRRFQKSFTLSEDMEVSSASLVDGMLTVKILKKQVERRKPLLIPLTTAS